MAVGRKSPAGTLLVAAVLLASAARATDYTWSPDTGGSWQTPSNWGQETAYPSADDDQAYVRKWINDFTVTLDADVRVKTLEVLGTRTHLDLNDHTLEMTDGGYSAGFLVSIGSVPTARGQIASSGGLFVRDGTLKLAGEVPLGSQYYRAYLSLSNVALSGGFGEYYYSSRMILSGGSVWTPGKDQQIGAGYWRLDSQSQYSLLCVTGETSRIDAADYQLNIRTFENAFYVLDGATATYRDLLIGGTFRSTNCLASVDSATLTVCNEIQLGSDAINPSAAIYRSEVNLTRGSELSIAGRHARVTAPRLALYGKTASILGFTLPNWGFADALGVARAPLEVTNLAYVARNAAYEDMGPSQLRVTSRAWCNRHSEETATLVTFVSADADALADLLGNVVLTDYTAEEIAAGEAPVVTLGSDGKSIVITAPHVELQPPAFDVYPESSTALGTKVLRVTPTSYGSISTSFTSIELKWADNAELTGAATTNFLADASPVTGTLPQTLRYTLADIAAHKRYYGLMTLTTEEGVSVAKTFTFEGNDGKVDTYKWQCQTTGSWQDPASWATNDWPRGEDVVKFEWYQFERTVTLAEDAAFFKLDGNSKYPAISVGRTNFELNGHALRVTARADEVSYAFIVGGGGASPKDDLEPLGATVVFRNGSFEMLDPKMSWKYASSMQLGAMTEDGSGTMLLEDGASAVGDISLMCNASRLLVRAGSSWRPSRTGINFTMGGHTARKPYGAVCVTGACARIDLSACTMIVRGDRAGLYVLDGGRMDAMDVYVGKTAHVDDTLSSVASTRTSIRVDNGTIAATGKLELGWPDDVQLMPQLTLAGTNASVTVGGTVALHDSTGTTIAFEIPPEGYRTCPLAAGDLAYVALPDGFTDYGETALAIRGARAWARKNRNASMDLVTLAAPNAAALAKLKTNVTSDWGRLDAAALSVSDDGTRLVLTAPKLPGAAIVVR